MNAVKVELFGPPNRITHQFDWDRGVVLHSFEYEPSTTQAGTPGRIAVLYPRQVHGRRMAYGAADSLGYRQACRGRAAAESS